MKFVGVDLQKKTISICVVAKVRGQLKVIDRKRFACRPTDMITQYLQTLGRFQLTVESTIGYEWFAALVEPLCDRLVIAHPAKLRVIAESTRKTDKIDAQILAEFLAHDMLPAAWMPTGRVRQHRSLVRYRHRIQRQMTSLKNRSRGLLARYNEDRSGLFTKAEQLKARKGSKQAITAIARRQLVVIAAMLRRGAPYDMTAQNYVPTKAA